MTAFCTAEGWLLLRCMLLPQGPDIPVFFISGLKTCPVRPGRWLASTDEISGRHLVSHAFTIHIPSRQMENEMTSNIVPLRDRGAENEKITINLGYVDLGRIDLLVQDGFYSNRTDFIRTAIRNQIQTESEVVSKSITRQTLELGLRDYSRADLETVRRAGEQLQIRVVGLVRIASDVTPELALATIASLTVLGALQASAEIKAALGNRIH